MTDITLDEVKESIKDIAVQYLTAMEEESDYGEKFVVLQIDSLIDEYKSIRNFPDSADNEDIEADVIRYFNRKKSYIGTQVIPALLTKAGAEGLETLIDNQVSKYWGKSYEMFFKDVSPYCEVV